jgi:hypothetical protein
MEVKLHALFISALDGCCQHNAPAALIPGKSAPCIHWVGKWAGLKPVWTQWQIDKFLPLPGIEFQSFSPYPVSIATELSKLDIK